MERAKVIECLAAVVVMAGLCRPAAALDIVKDGNPVATVVLPDKPDVLAQEAARQVVENVRLCTGATLSTVSEAQAPAEGTLISIGKTAAADKLNLDVDKQLADTYFLRVQGRTLFLLGRDAGIEKTGPKTPWGAEGTLNAAFAFLRDYAGVRWVMPGPCGVWTPKTAGISVPDDLDRKVAPTLLYIQGMMLESYFPWSRANGARCTVQKFGGSETWGYAFPPDQYAKDHPEYYALRDGKRLTDSTAGGSSLCTSNPEVVNILTAWLQSKFDQGYDIVPLGECDGYRPRACQCAECNKLFGDSDWKKTTTRGIALRVYLPHMEVCKRLMKSHPNKFVQLLVYSLEGEYFSDIAAGRAPNPGIAFPPNTVADMCGASWLDIVQMQSLIPHVSNYEYWWCQFHGGLSPKQTPLSASLSIRRLVELKSLGLYTDGSIVNWPGEAPTFYVALRSTQDLGPTPEDLMKEFCAGLYGKAAGTLLQYYTLLYGRVRTTLDNNMCYCCDHALFPDMSDDHTLGEKYVTFWPEPTLKKMEGLLKKAEGEAQGDERALNWIRLARIGYDQVNVTAAVYRAERAYEANKSVATLRAIKPCMDAFNQFVQRINDLPKADPKFVQDYFPDYKSFMKGLLNNEGYGAGRGVPFTWNLDDSSLQQGKLP